MIRHLSLPAGFVLALALAAAAPRPVLAWEMPSFALEWGSKGSSPGQFGRARGIACDGAGNVYVSDTNNDRIQKFDGYGSFLLEWGSHGTSPGQFRLPTAIAVGPSGNVYVMDSMNERVQVFDSGGTFLFQWGSPGSGDGQFGTFSDYYWFEMGGLAIDPAGNVYVQDPEHFRVEKFTAAGTFISQLGGQSCDPFCGMSGMACDAAGDLFVGNYLGDHTEIREYDSAGNFIRRWPTHGCIAIRLAVDSANQVYVAGPSPFMVGEVAAVYTVGGIRRGLVAPYGMGPGELDFALAVALNGADDIYVTDGDEVKKYTYATVDVSPILSATFWNFVDPTGQTVQFTTEWTTPTSLSETSPVTATLNAQAFGAFMPDGVELGTVNVPSIPPGGSTVVSLEFPADHLPAAPETILPGGGPGSGAACGSGNWDGSLDVRWPVSAGLDRSETHSAAIPVQAGGTESFIAVASQCGTGAGNAAILSTMSPGFHARLLGEDRLTPAPDPLPANWHGYLALSADAGVADGTQSCAGLWIPCDTTSATISVCATACAWTTAVAPDVSLRRGGLLSASPNPSAGRMQIQFACPQPGPVRLEVFDLAGHRVAVLLDHEMSSGTHELDWSPRSAPSGGLKPGAYFLRLNSAGREDSRMFVSIR